MGGGAIAGIVIAALAVLLIIYVIAAYNRFIHIKTKIAEAESGIDVALTKRYDMLTKEIETVKGYAKHEKELQIKTVEMRANMTVAEKNDAMNAIEQAHKGITLLAENYPDLKASENFKQLQLSIADAEEHLQAARRVYNANTTLNNKMVKSFPSNLVSKVFGFKNYEFFAADEKKRQDVEINF